jgi:regulator of RNase E activity RraB
MSFLNSLFRAKPNLPKYDTNVRSYPDEYDGKPVYTIVDLGLADIAPVPDFTRYIAVILPVRITQGEDGPAIPDEELKALQRLEDRCIREAETRGFLYAGQATFTSAEHLYIAFYCRERDKDEAIDALLRVCRANGRDPTRVFSREDKDWTYYTEQLHPSIYQLQPLNHEEVLEDLQSHGDDGRTPRPVTFWLNFSTKAQAERCVAEATEGGFTLNEIADMRGEKDFQGDKPFCLTIKKEMALTMEGLNEEAWKLIDMAKKYGGEYDGIETDIVKG